MSFMQPEVWFTETYIVETTCGTEVVPVDVAGSKCTIEDLEQYLEGEVSERDKRQLYSEDVPGENDDDESESKLIILEPEQKWLARLSAPGYLDCTDTASFDSELEALEYLLDMYGTQDDSEPEDWEEAVEERIAELQKLESA